MSKCQNSAWRDCRHYCDLAGRRTETQSMRLGGSVLHYTDHDAVETHALVGYSRVSHAIPACLFLRTPTVSTSEAPKWSF